MLKIWSDIHTVMLSFTLSKVSSKYGILSKLKNLVYLSPVYETPEFWFIIGTINGSISRWLCILVLLQQKNLKH